MDKSSTSTAAHPYNKTVNRSQFDSSSVWDKTKDDETFVSVPDHPNNESVNKSKFEESSDWISKPSDKSALVKDDHDNNSEDLDATAMHPKNKTVNLSKYEKDESKSEEREKLDETSVIDVSNAHPKNKTVENLADSSSWEPPAPKARPPWPAPSDNVPNKSAIDLNDTSAAHPHNKTVLRSKFDSSTPWDQPK